MLGNCCGVQREPVARQLLPACPAVGTHPQRGQQECKVGDKDCVPWGHLQSQRHCEKEVSAAQGHSMCLQMIQVLSLDVRKRAYLLQTHFLQVI